jgi:predicted O-linked N-acetylglucosamine transferase (SPINDLY family)
MTPADPRSAEASGALIDEGHRLEDAGSLEAALAKYRDAVSASPHYPRAHLNVGNVLQRLGRTTEAVAALKTALRIDPAYTPAQFNLGLLHLDAGNLDAAEVALRAAMKLNPALPDPAIALANVLELRQRPLEAEQQLQEVMARTPSCAPAAYNLALLLQKRGETDEAEHMFRVCVAADPAFLPACAALGTLLRNAGLSRTAEPWYRRVLAANPHAGETWSALLLSLLNRDDLSAQQVFAEHQHFGAAFPEDPKARIERNIRTARHARIRVGFISGDFVQHPVALFLRPLLEHIDRAHFEVFCYSNNRTEDWMTQEIRSRADHWQNIEGQDDAGAAQRIRADELDVLVDLSGHAARSRLLLFNLGCAPVQATWLGYLHSTGMDSVDFRISDGQADSVGKTEHLHSEQLLRLPGCQWCYSPVLDVPRVPMRSREGSAGVVFGSFNHQSKISERCIALWSRVLSAVPDSTLRIYNAWPGRATSALPQRFQQHGINAGRVSTHAGMNIDRYFAAIGNVDIALDSFPYNGGTTTFDILWMEVPLVALAGDRPVSRSGLSILANLGMPELIAATDDEYVAINARLAADATWRLRLRETLRTRMLASPLMDARRFALAFEDGLRRMLDVSRSA